MYNHIVHLYLIGTISFRQNELLDRYVIALLDNQSIFPTDVKNWTIDEVKIVIADCKECYSEEWED
jgi:hypothetical protein